MEEEVIDRISALPEVTIHHILSFLYPKEVKLTSVLSKTWHRIISNCPFLDFDDSHFGYAMWRFNHEPSSFSRRYPNVEKDIEKYLNYVTETLNRFHKYNLRILRFSIHITLVKPGLVELLDSWIGLVLEHGVEKFDLYARTGDDVAYNLPRMVFAAKSIKIVKLHGCSLLQSFPRDDIVKFSTSQLLKLSLEAVDLDENILRSVISNCPLIEELSLLRCHMIKRIRISHLPKLKSFVISCGMTNSIESVEVESPSLRSLSIVVSGNHWPPKISMIKCPGLTDLILQEIDVEDEWLQDLVSRLSFLCNLKLTNLGLRRVKISSHSINRLTIVGYHLEELEIDAPNLCSFRFHGDLNPLITSMHPIGKSKVFLYCDGKGSLFETNLFVKLRNFIMHVNQVKLLDIHLPNFELNFQELKGSNYQAVPNIEQLKFVVTSPRSYPNLFNGLLWSCHPHTMFIEFKEIGVATMIVLEIIKHHLACSSCSNVGSWLHHLEDELTVVTTEGTENELSMKEFTSLNSMRNDSCHGLKFKFKW